MPRPTDRPLTVLITGASSGIGAGIARRLMSQKKAHRLVLTARRAESLEALAAEARDRGCEALVAPDDLADPEAPGRLIEAAVARFGGLDVLINNAGLGLPEPFARADPSAMARQIQVNFTAPLLLARLALPHLIASKGSIINVGSSITCVANPIFGAYGATKAGLAYWNDALRREMRPRGVSVCLVEPGPVHTEFFDSLSALAPPGGAYNPLLDAPRPWMSADVEDVARRIVGLLGRPRRRLSVRRRVVWPFRCVGALFRAWPALGDLALSSMVRHFDRAGDLSRPARNRDLREARPTE